jgi:hypothetical protein
MGELVTDERKPTGLFPRTRSPRDTGEELVDLRAQVEVMIATVTTRLNEGAGAMSRLAKDVEGASASANAAFQAALDARKFPWKTVTPFILFGLSALGSLLLMLGRVADRHDIEQAQAATQERLRAVEADVARIRTEAVRSSMAVEAIQKDQAEQSLVTVRLEQKLDSLMMRTR